MRLSFFISIFLSLIGVMIVQSLFMSNAVDGNNTYLGFFGLVFVVPFILLSLFITYRYFSTIVKQTKEKFIKGITILASLLLLVFLGFYSLEYKNQHLPNSALFPPLTDKTFQVYLNFYTFAFIHTVSAFIGGVVALFKKK